MKLLRTTLLPLCRMGPPLLFTPEGVRLQAGGGMLAGRGVIGGRGVAGLSLENTGKVCAGGGQGWGSRANMKYLVAGYKGAPHRSGKSILPTHGSGAGSQGCPCSTYSLVQRLDVACSLGCEKNVVRVKTSTTKLQGHSQDGR